MLHIRYILLLQDYNVGMYSKNNKKTVQIVTEPSWYGEDDAACDTTKNMRCPFEQT